MTADTFIGVQSAIAEYEQKVLNALVECYKLDSTSDVGVSKIQGQTATRYTLNGRLILSLDHNYIERGDRWLIEWNIRCEKIFGDFLNSQNIIQKEN